MFRSGERPAPQGSLLKSSIFPTALSDFSYLTGWFKFIYTCLSLKPITGKGGRISVIGLALDLSRSSALVALLPCVREERYGWCEVHCHVHTILAVQDPTPSSDRREILLQVPLIDAHLLLSRRGSVCTQVSDLVLAIILWFTLLISNGRKERAQIWPNVSPLSFPEITFGPGLEERS